MPRDELLQVRLDQDEMKIIEKKARKAGMNRTVFARVVLRP